MASDYPFEIFPMKMMKNKDKKQRRLIYDYSLS
jgi:hypothetical protein